MAAAQAVARVLLDSALPQLDHLFDYRVPESLRETALPGVRVRVPLRTAGRIADGYLVELVHDGDFSGKLSDLDAVVSPARVLSDEVWNLARRVADRGAGGASDVIRLAVPSRQVRVEKAWLAAPRNTSVAGASEAPVISGYPDGRLEAALENNERLAVSAIPHLAELPDGAWVGRWAITLAEAATRCVLGGRSAILVVPDYRDQEQLAAALATIAPDGVVAALDARQSNPDRYRAFLSCLDGPRIIIGNRSAVYAPADKLGLLAIFSDGDPLHAEPLSPYVHARDAALVRQEQQGCALWLVGHSRTVETQRLVELGWLHEVVPARTAAPKIVPTAQQAASDPQAQAARIPSTAWREARAALERGPVLVQVARPGYAPSLACDNCHQAARCTRCEGPLSQSTARSVPSCGWCGALATDWVCDNCEHTKLRRVGAGSARTVEDLGRAFPGVRVVIADGEHPVRSVDAKPALVVATRGAEPIAAGGYQAILLLDGERMLARESLRIGEDCLRWWMNAAALAAPGATTMLVGVAGPLAQAMATWRTDGYASRELADRRELRFPPAVRVASITGASQAVEAAIAQLDAETVLDTLGPVPLDAGLVRSIVRFEYGHGADVAATLRAAVIRNATSRRKAPAGKGGFRPAPTLRVRFDDPEIL